jgi:glutathione synthase/RimK-type ligase-like ATP-grasp enzyme
MNRLRNRRYVISKWLKTKALLPNPKIAAHIPDTRKMTRTNLLNMLNTYTMVYVKPSSGTYGNGVMRVERCSDSSYRFQNGTKSREFSSYDAMYDTISKLTQQRLYLVQKGIHLLKFNHRPFDLRVMVQQSPEKIWVTMGIIGRVAAPQKVVTNVHNGGTLKPVETLVAKYARGARKKRLIGQLRKLGTSVARQMHIKYRGIKEMGLDVALDKRMHPWILEVNTCPDPYIFRRLKDKSIFTRIASYARAYGKK